MNPALDGAMPLRDIGGRFPTDFGPTGKKHPKISLAPPRRTIEEGIGPLREFVQGAPALKAL